jgi:O-antigen/teichoic acid export membrane protein/glycosyltransferase involved in cell wall biosynthesis
MLPVAINSNSELVVARCTCTDTTERKTRVERASERATGLHREKGSYVQILKSSALVGGAQVANIAIGIVRTKTMALLLGPAGFGLFGLYNSILGLAQNFSSMGINSSGVRQIAEATATNDQQRIGQTTAVLRTTCIALGVLGGLLLLLFARPVAQLTFGNTTRAGAVALLAVAVFLSLVSSGQSALIQGMRRIADLAKMNVLGAFFGLCISIPLVYFLREDGVVPSLVAVAGMAILTSWWYSRKIDVQRPVVTFSQVRQEATALLKLGSAFMASTIMTMGVAYFVRIVILRKVGVDATGYYQSAWTLGGLYVSFILQAMGADFYPRLTASIGNHDESNRLVNEQTLVGLLIAGPGVIATLTCAPLVITLLYSAKFGAAVEVLRWICLGAMLQVITWPMGFIVVAKGRPALFFFVELAWTVVALALSWLCVGRYGLKGAGIAFFASYIFHWILIYPVAQWLTGFRWSAHNQRIGSLLLLLIAVVFSSFYILPFIWAAVLGIALTIASGVYSLRILFALVPADRLPPALRKVLSFVGAKVVDQTPWSVADTTTLTDTPRVSFVVPCYKLGHLLPECLTSILSQSYRHFEVLILDDCSPDKTAEVARSFHDPRVKYIRNEKNLGHLQNYNRGIAMAKGQYIWLISADDRLRTPGILERYLGVMEKHPRVGYACCPAMSLENGVEAHLEGSISKRDSIFSGKEFAKQLVKRGNFVIAASGIVRRDCYEKLGAFPLDLPYAGDWFLWCLFALHYDVAYFREPMVNYRQHDLSMTNQLTGELYAVRFKDGLAVLWRIHHEANALGYSDLVRLCRQRIAYQYAHNMVGRRLGNSAFSMSLEEFERSLDQNATDHVDKLAIRARTWEIVADSCFRRRDFEQAQNYYTMARKFDGWRPTILAKQALLHLRAGHVVVDFKDRVVDLRRTLAASRSH